MPNFLIAVSTFACCWSTALVATGQDVAQQDRRPATTADENIYYHPSMLHFRMSDDSYRSAEQRRLADINHQIVLIDEVKWWLGIPTQAEKLGYPVPPPVYGVAAEGGRMGWDTGYGTFRPVYRPPFVGTVPQSVMQRREQVGPNRWLSYPVDPESLRRTPATRTPDRLHGPPEF